MRALIDVDHLHVDLDHAVWLCWLSMLGLVAIEQKLAMLQQVKRLEEQPTRDVVRHFTEIIVSVLRSATAS